MPCSFVTLLAVPRGPVSPVGSKLNPSIIQLSKSGFPPRPEGFGQRMFGQFDARSQVATNILALLPTSMEHAAVLMATVEVAHAWATRGPLIFGLPISVANHGTS